MPSNHDRYLRFAEEAMGRSPAYVRLANAVAGDPAILSFLDTLPWEKSQPNLLFGAAYYLLREPAGVEQLRSLVSEYPSELAREMVLRRTQTNEAARCATLLPALAQLPQPLALIEVGASAGLTLLFDKYSYDYDGHLVTGHDRDAPVLRCGVTGPVPLPDRVPEILWRAGLDLNPLDVRSEDDMRWLSCMVWPGEGDRLERLAAAIAAARRDPPRIHRGDLRTDLPALAAQAPADATLVVYHTAVLNYLPRADREQFGKTVAGLRCVWLSNEAPGVVAGITPPANDRHNFLLIRDGSTLVATTDSHGTGVQWLV
ncbi:MAG TPA: DUF2332 domain-containing protein [Streptosporangiaceae bacterium]|jgi:hypothetical protein